MPDPAKVKAAVIGGVLVIGASIGIGISVSKKNRNVDGVIVENFASIEDSSPTRAEEILEELEQSSARYSAYTEYSSNPLEEKNKSDSDENWEGNGAWLEGRWDDDGWNAVSGWLYSQRILCT